MMTLALIAIFVGGYVCVALEHRLKVDKSAIALLMFGAIWTVYACCSPVGQSELVEHLGATCETLVFLIGAMTIVEIIDSYGGFAFITERITTRSKWRLLWVLAVITFLLSAIFKILDDFKVNVGFKESKFYLTHTCLNVGFGKLTLASELFEGILKLFA